MRQPLGESRRGVRSVGRLSREDDMTFTMKVNMDNAAFEFDDELANILAKVAQKASGAPDEGICMDSNGNRVGTW